tara:strand:- start:9108 stop:9617 length:510 start_codon:yes stop_codon:yes gene_type:complete
MDLSDVIDEMEEASSRADEAKDLADSAVDQLKDKLEEINQLKNDWREYLDEHVHEGDIAEYVINNCGNAALNAIGGQSLIYKLIKKQLYQEEASHDKDVQANRLARALMFAAFSQERAGRQTDWVKPLLDKDARFARRQKIDELLFRNRSLCSQMRQMQSEIEELRGDA